MTSLSVIHLDEINQSRDRSTGGPFEMSAKHETFYDGDPQARVITEKRRWLPSTTPCFRSRVRQQTANDQRSCEALFGVKVKAVNTSITKGKAKRFPRPDGSPEGRQEGLLARRG